MKCPYCGSTRNIVKDIRPRPDGKNWRRRKCMECGKRFTTLEKVDRRERDA